MKKKTNQTYQVQKFVDRYKENIQSYLMIDSN